MHMTTTPEERKLELTALLKAGKLQVSFTKLNGEKREMVCTLNEELLPQSTDTIVTAKPRVSNPNTIAVYDLDKHDWRSFRIDSLIETKIV